MNSNGKKTDTLCNSCSIGDKQITSVSAHLVTVGKGDEQKASVEVVAVCDFCSSRDSVKWHMPKADVEQFIESLRVVLGL